MGDCGNIRNYIPALYPASRLAIRLADLPVTIKYDIFKSDSAGRLLRVEAIGGLEQATNRIEELAAVDPTSDYFLYCAEAGKVIRHLQRTSARSGETAGDASRKKTG